MPSTSRSSSLPSSPVDPPPRYQQLGTYELVAAVPEGHRLAKCKHVPRSELLKESFLDAPANINPELFAHIHKALFGEIQHPQRVEVPLNLLDEARGLELVAQGKGIGVTAMHPGLERPGVVFHPLDKDTPPLGYGVAWPAIQASPFLESFIKLAREIAASDEDPSSPA